MMRTRTSSSKLLLAKETVRRLVDSDLVHVGAAGGVETQAISDVCFTQDCPPKRDPQP